MKTVYVAGKYSANNVMDMFENVRLGIRGATEVMLAGYAPFCPFLDYHFKLILRDGEHISLDMYYAYSIAWLERSDAVLVLPGWEKSKGVIAEIARAHELHIPVFYSLDELLQCMPPNSDKNVCQAPAPMEVIPEVEAPKPEEKTEDTDYKKIVDAVTKWVESHVPQPYTQAEIDSLRTPEPGKKAAAISCDTTVVPDDAKPEG